MAPLDPRYLMRLSRGRLISHDEWCRKCRYNLRGLRSSGRCPECGTPIDFQFAREAVVDYGPQVIYHDPGPFLEAPRRYVQRLAGVFTALGVSGLLMLAAFGALVALPVPAVAGAATGLAAAWGAVCWAVAAPRQVARPKNIDTAGEWTRLRRLVRWSQPAWAALGLVCLARTVPGWTPGAGGVPRPLGAVLSALGAALGCVAGFGAAALWVHLSNLLFWIGDTRLAGRLRECAWVQAGATIVAVPLLATGATRDMIAGTLDWSQLSQVLAAVLPLAALGATLFPAYCLVEVWVTARWIGVELRDPGRGVPGRGRGRPPPGPSGG